MFGASAFWKQSKSKSKTHKTPLKRTEELQKLFDNFMDDFFGGEASGQSVEQALQAASRKLRTNIAESQGMLEDLYRTTSQDYGTSYGGLSNLAKDIESKRAPIDIGFGGEKMLTMIPHAKQLGDIYSQMGDMVGTKSGMLSDLLSQRSALGSSAAEASLMPKMTLMDLYERLMLPQELARIGEFEKEATKGTNTSYGASASSGTGTPSYG
jgi:hypothetical protein